MGAPVASNTLTLRWSCARAWASWRVTTSRAALSSVLKSLSLRGLGDLYEVQGQHHRQIVGVLEIGVGSAGDCPISRGHDHPDVPAVAQAGDRPVAEDLAGHHHRAHHHRQRWDEGAIEERDLEACAEEEAAMEELHEAKVPLPQLHRAARQGPLGVAPADP